MTSLENQSIVSLLRRIADSQFSPVEWVNLCMDRISDHDSSVLAWVGIDAQGAARQAAELNEDLSDPRSLGPLHGVPIGIKDIIDVAGQPTAAGFGPWVDRMALADAPIVATLRGAGAVILGKTVTTQFACFDPASTKNPWNPKHTPGGSSSGSAAAVASGMCAAALGTQTGGSIIRPAAYCGIVGLKPTFQSLSMDGIVPVSRHLDHVGPMAKSVEDVAYLWHVLSSSDKSNDLLESLASFEQSFSGNETFDRLLLFDDFWDSAEFDSEQSEILSDVLKVLEQQGIRFERGSLPIPLSEIREHHWTLMAHDAYLVHRERLGNYAAEYLPNIRSLLEAGQAIDAEYFSRSLNHQREFGERMHATLKPAKLVLLPATNTPAPASVKTTGSPLFNSPWSYCGFPEVCLPAGVTDAGLPIGLQLVSVPGTESSLLRAARQLERMIGFRHEPKFIG